MDERLSYILEHLKHLHRSLEVSGPQLQHIQDVEIQRQSQKRGIIVYKLTPYKNDSTSSVFISENNFCRAVYIVLRNGK